MSIGPALFDELSNTAAITALVSTRIYPNMAPQGAALPYIVYNQVSGVIERHMTDVSNLRHPRFQIDCYGNTFLNAVAVEEAVVAALEHTSGTWDSGGANQTVVRRVFVENIDDGFDAPRDGGDVPVHRRVLDILIWHRT